MHPCPISSHLNNLNKVAAAAMAREAALQQDPSVSASSTNSIASQGGVSVGSQGAESDREGSGPPPAPASTDAAATATAASMSSFKAQVRSFQEREETLQQQHVCVVLAFLSCCVVVFRPFRVPYRPGSI